MLLRALVLGGVLVVTAPPAVVAAQPTSSSSTSTSTAPSTTSTTSTTLPPATTSAPATTTSSTTSTTAPAVTDDEAGLSDTALILIAAIIALLLIIGAVLLLMRRRAHGQWRDQTRAAVAEAHGIIQTVTQGLATLGQPAAAAATWAEVDNRGSDLHARLQALAAKPPDPQVGNSVVTADRTLQPLRAAVESDRALRLGPPPPTPEQLSYSEAVVRERVTEFRQAVDELSANLIR